MTLFAPALCRSANNAGARWPPRRLADPGPRRRIAAAAALVGGAKSGNQGSLATAILVRLGDDVIIADDRMLYDHRDWLIPFVSVSTGSADIDSYMDNALAYALSAGTTEHSEDELQLMRQLLPGLTKLAEEKEDASFWDTVGCVHFVLGDRAAALKAFQAAQSHLADIEEDNEKALALRRIVNERSKAAMDPEAPLPLIWGHDGHVTIEGERINWPKVRRKTTKGSPSKSFLKSSPRKKSTPHCDSKRITCCGV